MGGINREVYSNIISGALRFNNVPKPRKYTRKETAQLGPENEPCCATSPNSPLLSPKFTFQNWSARRRNSPTPFTTNKGSCTHFLLASFPHRILLPSSIPNLAIGAVCGLGDTTVSNPPMSTLIQRRKQQQHGQLSIGKACKKCDCIQSTLKSLEESCDV